MTYAIYTVIAAFAVYFIAIWVQIILLMLGNEP